MADRSPPEKQTRYRLRSSAKANPVESASKLESKPKQSRYVLRSTAKRNASSIEVVQPPTKRKSRRNTPKKLMHLNDDCLLEMLEYMSLDDLCNLAETNQRIHGLAQYQFSHKYKDFKSKWLMNGHNELINLDTFKRVLRIFGHHIVSMKISTSHFVEEENTSENLLLLISRYCGKNLKTLKLSNFTISPLMDARYKKMFDRIMHLVLVSGWIDWFPMKSLKTLKLIEVDSDWNCVSLPTIVDVELSCVENMETENLVEFLTLNRSIEYLSLTQCTEFSTDVCKAIGEIENLRQLLLQWYGDITSEGIFQQGLNYLSSLKNLKVLGLDCENRSISSLLAKFVANGVGLVRLQLADVLLDNETFEHIKKLKTLKILAFNGIDDITNSHIIILAEELQSLSEFYINSKSYISQTAIRALVRDLHQIQYLKIDCPYFKLDLDLYHEILTAIRKRTDKKYMQLVICKGEQMMVPNDVVNGPNGKWLNVEVKSWYLTCASADNFDSDSI